MDRGDGHFGALVDRRPRMDGARFWAAEATASRDAWAQTHTQDLACGPRGRIPVTSAHDLARVSSAFAPASERSSNQIHQPEPLVPTIAPPEIFKVCAWSTECLHELAPWKGTASRFASQ